MIKNFLLSEEENRKLKQIVKQLGFVSEAEYIRFAIFNFYLINLKLDKILEELKGGKNKNDVRRGN